MKRILKFIGCLALGCVGLTTLADTVAKIGETPYETLQAALDDAHAGDVIKIQVSRLTVKDYVGAKEADGSYASKYGYYTEITGAGKDGVVCGETPMAEDALANVVLRRQVTGKDYMQKVSGITIEGCEGGTELGTLDVSGSNQLILRNFKFDFKNAVMSCSGYGNANKTCNKEGIGANAQGPLFDTEHVSSLFDASYNGRGATNPDGENTASYDITVENCVFTGANSSNSTYIAVFASSESGHAGTGQHNWAICDNAFDGHFHACIDFNNVKCKGNVVTVSGNKFGLSAETSFAYGFVSSACYGKYVLNDNEVKASIWDHMFSPGIGGDTSADYETEFEMSGNKIVWVGWTKDATADIFNLKQSPAVVKLNGEVIGTGSVPTGIATDDALKAKVATLIAESNKGISAEYVWTDNKHKLTLGYEAFVPPVEIVVEENETAGITPEIVAEITANPEVEKVEQKAIVEAIKEDVEGKDEAFVKVKLEKVETEATKTTLQFEVAPYIGTEPVAAANIKGAVPFRLPLLREKFVEYAKISHEGDPDRFVLVKKGANGEPYVDLSLTHFSTVLASAVTAAEMVPEGAALVTPDKDGFFVLDDVYYIVGKDGLKNFRDWVNAGSSGENKTFQLVADVDLENEEWTPIGNGRRSGKQPAGNVFKGTFNGNGKEISSFKITNTETYNGDVAAGLFGVVDGGTVSNFTVNATINLPGDELAACAVGFLANGGMVEGVVAKGSVTAKAGIGGIVGRLTYRGKILNCENQAAITGVQNVGGIVGAAYCDLADQDLEDMVIAGCVNRGMLTSSSCGVGGIAGLSVAAVRDCVNYGIVSSTGTTDTGCGGIIGNQKDFGEIVRCVNNGNVNCENAKNVAGILGRYQPLGHTESGKNDYPAYMPLTLDGNVNNGKVSGQTYCAGLVGYTDSQTITLKNNENNGQVLADGSEGSGLLDAGAGTRNVVNNVSTTTTDSTKLVVGWNADLAKANSTAWVAADADGNKYATVAYAISQGLGTPAKPFALLADATIELTAADETYNFIANGHKVTVVSKVADMVGITSPGENGQTVAKLVAALTKGEGDKYHITNLDELKAFRAMVNVEKNDFAGETVSLDASIDLANEEWEPIGVTSYRTVSNDSSTTVTIGAVFNGSFLGNGNTISNLKISATKGGFAYNASVGFFGNVGQKDANIVISDLTINNVHIAGRLYVGAIAGQCKFQTLCFTNCHVTGEIQIEGSWYLGGICGKGYSKVVDCSVIGAEGKGNYIRGCYPYVGDAYNDYDSGNKGWNGYVGGIWGHRGEGDNVVIQRGVVKNLFIEGDCGGVGGIQAIAQAGNKMLDCTVENCTVRCLGETGYCGLIAGSDNGSATGYGPVTLADCTVTASKAYEHTADGMTGTDNLKEIDYLIGHRSSAFVVKDDTNRATVGWDITFDEKGKVVSGTFDQISKTVLAPGSVMDIDPTTGKITVLGPLVPDDQGVYHIATMQDLTVFRLMVNGGITFAGKTVVLDNDITFAGEWDSGIGDGDHKFMGMFDGQGYKITGLKISAADKDTIGLFGFVDESGAEVWNAWVKNLVLDGAQIVGKENVGGIVGYVHRGIIENCTITNSTISGTVKVGSVAGMMYPGRCIGNTIVATTVSGTSHIGGVAGQMVGGSVSGNVLGGDDAASKVTVTATAKKDECGAGGLVGAVSCSDGGKNYVNDNTIKCAEAITDGVTAPIPFCDFRKNLFSKDESKVEIKRNTWPTVDPNADYYDMVDFASTSEPKDYLRVNNFHPVAEIAGKGPEYRYETLEAALNAASALTGTVAEPTVVQLYPGEVKGGSNIGQLSCNLKNVVIQGAEDGTSTLTNCKINWQADSHEFENVTFKNIIFDNSRVVFSTNSKEKDMAFIGNTFRNLVNIDNNGGVHFNSACQNLTYENNVFEGSISGSTAAINTRNVTGNITIRNNVISNSCWRSVQLMFNSNDGIDDNVTLTDNWFVGNMYWIQINGQTAEGGDAVGINVNYNVFDENAANGGSIQVASFNAAKTSLALDHNYYTLSPDAAPDAFNVGGYRTAGNIYDAGVYPYYNAYYKEDLAAGTMTVRESLYNLVDPAAIVVNEDGKFVKMTIADAMAASKPGESVMLIRDATDEEVMISGDVTFDKNGKNCGVIKAAEGYLLVDLGGGKYIAKTPVAEIVGGQQYDTLEKAIAAVTQNQTIKMLANVALTKVLDIPADKSFTLDLNGKKISDAETGFDWSVSNVPTGTPANLMIVLRGTMKVCDKSANQDGSIWTDDFGYTKTKAVLVADNGNLTLESGTIYGEYAGCYVVGYTGDDPAHTPIVPTLTLNGGVISGGKLGVGVKGMTAKLTLNDGAAIKSKAWYGISTNGTTDWYDGGNCQITVNGGLVECEEGPAIYNPAESIVQIKGGVVKGLSGIAVKGGNVTISGDASVIATGVKVAPVYVQSGVEVTGDAIYIEDSYDNHKPVVSVVGGMLKSANGHAVQYWTNKAADKIGSLSIAGGTLVAAKDEAAVLVGSSVGPANFIKAQVGEDGKTETGYPLFNSRIIPQYIAEGYIEKDNGNGTWTVTKGQAEIEVVIKPVTPTTEMAEGMTEEEKTEGEKQAEQIKENIVAALSDPSISDIVGTGIIEATRDTDGKLRDYVVTALKAAAPGLADHIDADTSVKSHVEITFESLEVKVAIDESEQRVVKSTLNKVKYEIKPILTTYISVGGDTTKVRTRIPSDQILANPIEFALSLEPSFVSEMAKVTHLKADDATVIDTKTYPVKRDGEKAYIELAWNQFSFAEIEGQSVTDQVCTVNGDMYDSVATAAAAAADGAVITLLKDIPSDVDAVPLKTNQVIELHGKKFEAPLEGVAAGYELAKTPEGQAFIAPKKIEVPTTGEEGAPKIKVRLPLLPGKTKEQTIDALQEIQPTSGRPLWADLVMGTDKKLIPFVPRSPIGIGTVTIRTTLPDSTFVRTAATARDGVSVKYQLKKRVGNGDFLEYGEVKAIPVFTVEAAELETRTSWKIETIFDEEY